MNVRYRPKPCCCMGHVVWFKINGWMDKPHSQSVSQSSRSTAQLSNDDGTMHDSPNCPIKTNYWLVDCRVVPSSFSETLNWPANELNIAIYRKIRYLFRRYDTIRYIDIENDISIFRYIESSLVSVSVAPFRPRRSRDTLAIVKFQICNCDARCHMFTYTL